MPNKKKKNKKNKDTFHGTTCNRPPAAPGRTARVVGLVNRSDLNDEEVTIKEVLNSGRVAVEVVRLRGTDFEKREVVAIRPENLEVQWSKINGSKAGDDMQHWGVEVEECPICMDSMMDSNANRMLMDCCGGKICKKCFVQTQFTIQKDVCPLCRADTSDTSAAAAVRRIKARAERGDANAMYNLGGHYDGGLNGVRQDQALARIWFQKAAVKGESRAAHNLACSYRDGEGGPVDKALAAKYFLMSAKQGHVQSITCYGIALMGGAGVEKDTVEAKKWLTKGAKAGDELAVQQLQLLNMMSSSKGMANMSCSSIPGANVFSYSK